MSTNVCSWRATRVFLVAAALLCSFTGNVRSQEARTNRVWSIRLSIEACGIQITSARLAQIGPDGTLSEWRYINKDFLILQWSRDFAAEIESEEDTDYGLHDLLVDYAQTRYILHLIGVGDSGKHFTKMFWTSPVGVSEERIPPAPIRDRSKAWTVESFDELSSWYHLHTISSENWFREFSVLAHKSDKKLDLVIKIRGSACEETNEERL